MTTFSSGDAAFEGFRLTRENPRVVLAWSIFHFVVSSIGAVVLIAFGGDAMTQLAEQPEAAPDEMTALLRQMAPAYLILAPLGLATMSAIAAAVYRLQLRPQEGGFGHLRFGADEIRLVLLTLIYYVLAVIGLVGLILLAGVIAGVVAAVAPDAQAPAAWATLLFCGGLIIYALVRLSLAPVLTFQERRLVVFGSWSLTRGHFWRLLGAYVLAGLTIAVVTLLTTVIFAAVLGIISVTMGRGLEGVGAVFQPDFSSISAYVTVETFIYLVVTAVLNAIYYPVILSPQVVAYRAFRTPEPAPPYEGGAGI
ncbi:hypothetical protein [Phenylobacterium sp.]|uniref:hypothetical protein n=1 Tax=Phenylobacterium sp. TaxID=1871053 RepID=UPI0035C829F1